MSSTGTSANYIPVSDISAYNPNLDLSLYTETTLSGVITRASAWVDNYIGYTLTYETISNEKTESHVDPDGNLTIFPAKQPIDAVSAISIRKGNTILTMQINDGTNDYFDLVPSWKPTKIVYPSSQISVTGSGRLASFYDLKRTRFFTNITYTAGYQTIPSEIKDAVGLIASDFIARNINSTGANSVSQGEISYNFSDRSDGDSDKIRDAKQILNDYKRVSGF